MGQFTRATQLGETYCGVYIREIVLEAEVVDFVEPRAARVVTLPGVAIHPVQTGDADFRGERVVLSRDHPALGAGDIFGGVKTEAADIADRADLGHPTPVELPGRIHRVSGVLDNPQIVAARDRHDAIHIAGVAGEMDRHDRADVAMATARERLLDARRIDIESVGI